MIITNEKKVRQQLLLVTIFGMMTEDIKGTEYEKEFIASFKKLEASVQEELRLYPPEDILLRLQLMRPAINGMAVYLSDVPQDSIYKRK